MARIRTIKPEFFRHEGLQDLEAANPGRYPMLVFAGLWGHCDKAGRFEWKPRQLKLDVLPFLDFDMTQTLELLRQSGFLRSYTVDGKRYGVIPSFQDHQRIGGKEAQESAKHPEPSEFDQGNDRETLVLSPSIPGEAYGKQLGLQEGKGREGEKEGKGIQPLSCITNPQAEANGHDSGPPPPPEPIEVANGSTPRCPVDELVDLYHRCIPTAPNVRILTKDREAKLRLRWKEWAHDHPGATTVDGLAWFEARFRYAASSKFLTGKAPARNGGKPWHIDFDWIVANEQNVVKLFEEKYA